jgi:hypothetical protein
MVSFICLSQVLIVGYFARYDKEGEASQLASIDIYVSTVDPAKEPPIVTANTILSILSVDYPVDKVSCYLSDDGAAMLTFECLSETSEFARKWVPFCKKFSIEPRAPDMYFALKIDYLKDKVQPTFVKERRAMKVKLCFYDSTFVCGCGCYGGGICRISRIQRKCFSFF